METARVLLEGYGYWLLLGVGFAEFAGLPIASVPVLIVAGAAAAEGAISLPAAALAAALGGLLADTAWYSLSRWRGQRLVDTVCNLSSNPKSCVLTIANRLEKVGSVYVLPSKFVPGTGNLAAASELGRRIHRCGCSRGGVPHSRHARVEIRARAHAPGCASNRVGAAGYLGRVHGVGRGRGVGPDWTNRRFRA